MQGFFLQEREAIMAKQPSDKSARAFDHMDVPGLLSEARNAVNAAFTNVAQRNGQHVGRKRIARGKTIGYRGGRPTQTFSDRAWP